MPTTVKIIHSQDFIKATAEGELDLETSKRMLAEIVSASTPLDDYHIILDTRTAHSAMSATDLWYLAAELSEIRRACSPKTAVLCPRERFDSARFFALCAENRGFNVSAFISFEGALEWLISEEA